MTKNKTNLFERSSVFGNLEITWGHFFLKYSVYDRQTCYRTNVQDIRSCGVANLKNFVVADIFHPILLSLNSE